MKHLIILCRQPNEPQAVLPAPGAHPDERLARRRIRRCIKQLRRHVSQALTCHPMSAMMPCAWISGFIPGAVPRLRRRPAARPGDCNRADRRANGPWRVRSPRALERTSVRAGVRRPFATIPHGLGREASGLAWAMVAWRLATFTHTHDVTYHREWERGMSIGSFVRRRLRKRSRSER